MEAFAKKLVDSDGIIRTKAFVALGSWISERSGNLNNKDMNGSRTLDIKDYLRLWKALFYSMWMADKPAHQRSLAQRLGGLSLIILKAAQNETAVLLYFQAFWETLCREWAGLDRHRLDKYYNLIRRMVSASLECCIFLRWRDSFTVAYNQVLSDTVLHPTRGSVPDALRMYLLEETCSIYLSTLGSKGNLEESKIPSKVFMTFFDPLLDLIALCTKASVLKIAKDRFVPSILNFDPQVVSAEEMGKYIFSRGESDLVADANNRKILYEGGIFLQNYQKSKSSTSATLEN